MDKIKTAIAGMGGRGQGFLGEIIGREDVELVALCDPVAAKAKGIAAAAGCGKVPVYDAIEKLLAEAECEVVMVTSPDAHHAEIVVPALAAGKTVFCEKPLETTLEKCRAIVAADEQAGGKTFVGFNMRYAPVYAKTREILDAGELGRILTIQADEFYDGGRTYFRRWNRFRAEGGGLWITKASHDFDMISWFAGAPAREVYALAERSYYVPKPEAAERCRDCKLAPDCPDRAPVEAPPHCRLHEESTGEPYDLCLYNSGSDTFDHGIATIAFDNDIFATYTCNVVSGFSDRRLRIAGTKATLDGSLCNQRITVMRRDPTETVEYDLTESVAGGHGGADSPLLDSFFAFARGEAEPKCRPREAVIAIIMGLAATRAADEHRVVKLEEFKL